MKKFQKVLQVFTLVIILALLVPAPVVQAAPI